MSGGHFSHLQYRIGDIIDSIEDVIANNNDYGFSETTIDKFEIGLTFLRLAQIYAHRIDWLISSDDGEDTFHARLAENVKQGIDNDILEEMRWRDPHHELPVYTAQASGVPFVRVLICVDDALVTEGLYIDGHWELHGTVVPSITKWKPLPKP